MNREEAKKIVDMQIEKIFTTVPLAEDFLKTDWLDIKYYQRYFLENFLRIQENNQLVKTFLQFDDVNPILANDLSYYFYEKYGYDELSYSDLELIGINKEEANSTRLFFSTKLLMGFLYYEMSKEGALPVIVWNWFVEYYNQNYNNFVLTKVEKFLGKNFIQNSITSNSYYLVEDYSDRMFTRIKEVTKNHDDEEKARFYLEKFVELMGMSFQELYEVSFKEKKKEIA